MQRKIAQGAGQSRQLNTGGASAARAETLSDALGTRLLVTRALYNTGGALSHIARWEDWYAAGNFGQERL